MSNKALNTVALVIAVTLVHGANAFADTLVVGPATCGPDVVHYAAIQDAVNASQVLDTIAICPGIYAEQVVITQPLIVTGIDDGTGGAAVIVVPSTPLIPYPTLSGTVAAQVVLQNTWGVQLRNLTIDGAGGPCATTVGTDRTAGIALINLQSDDPSWINTYVGLSVILNQGGACGRSAGGILSDNSLVEIDQNSIHDIEGDALTLLGGTGVITSNLIENCGFAAIAMSSVQNATISDNTLRGVRYGVDMEASVNVNVWYNTMGPWLGYGVYTHNGSLSWLTGNSINATFFGIYLNGSLSDRVTDNYVVQTESIGLVDINSRGGNQIWTNTFDGAPVGIYVDDLAAADDLGPNEFVNVITPISTTANPF